MPDELKKLRKEIGNLQECVGNCESTLAEMREELREFGVKVECLDLKLSFLKEQILRLDKRFWALIFGIITILVAILLR